MRDLLGKSERFVTPPERLVRVPEKPQNPGRMREAEYSRIMVMLKAMGAILVAVVQDNALLYMFSGGDKRP
jgi:hypothetical protein